MIENSEEINREVIEQLMVEYAMMRATSNIRREVNTDTHLVNLYEAKTKEEVKTRKQWKNILKGLIQRWC